MRFSSSRAHRKTVAWLAVLLLAVFAVVATICYRTVPIGNTDAQHFDAILVLGTPARWSGGGITNAGIWLMDEAIREYRSGRAEHIIVSGGAVANKYTEADVLARYAHEMGVPDGVVTEERQARNTLQNVQNSAGIMKERGWNSVEVIGLQEHLPRAAVLLQTTSLRWQVRAAATPGRHRWYRLWRTAEEAVGVTVLRIFGVWTVPVLHAVKVVVGLPITVVKFIAYRLKYGRFPPEATKAMFGRASSYLEPYSARALHRT